MKDGRPMSRPSVDDPAAVEELAQWMAARFPLPPVPDGDVGGEYEQYREQWNQVARAVLAALAGEGKR